MDLNHRPSIKGTELLLKATKAIIIMQVYALNGCCEHQRIHLRTRSLQGVHMRSCMCSLFNQRWETRIGGFNWSMKAPVAWRGGLLSIQGKKVVLSVSSLFLTRVGVYVCVSVCIRTHTLPLHRWGTRM